MSASDLAALGLTSADIANWRLLVALEKKYNLVAGSKHAFSVNVTNKAPVKIPWTPTRIASIFIPTVAVWMGGDPSVTVAGGTTAGLPIVANAQVIFGPEEGSSDTWLIAQVPQVDVRCLELLPAAASST